MSRRRARIGYTRVSTVSQTLDQQSAALEAVGATKTFSDTMSGARDDSPGLAELREGDTVATAAPLANAMLNRVNI
ncbi:MAG: recombinase family protein [Mycobacterium sp.]|uniref:recombinase family protein n=1 Tax=Mycobacterium sp. TaxID=1785 RepID=UPI003F9B8D51